MDTHTHTHAITYKYNRHTDTFTYTHTQNHAHRQTDRHTHTRSLTGKGILDKSFPILFFMNVHKFSLTLGFGLIVSLRFLMVGSHDVRKLSVATQLFCIMYIIPSVVIATGRFTYIRLLVAPISQMIFIT